jgi:hypothetical protein
MSPFSIRYLIWGFKPAEHAGRTHKMGRGPTGSSARRPCVAGSRSAARPRVFPELGFRAVARRCPPRAPRGVAVKGSTTRPFIGALAYVATPMTAQPRWTAEARVTHTYRVSGICAKRLTWVGCQLLVSSRARGLLAATRCSCSGHRQRVRDTASFEWRNQLPRCDRFPSGRRT